jgi:hypothetical protein
MICPWCQADLKQRDRVGRRCNKCRREYALDPTTNALLLHDLRLRRLAGVLGDEGRLAYTADQLRYAAARKPLSSPGWRSKAITFGFLSVVTLVVTVAAATGGDYRFAGIAAFLSLAFAAAVVLIRRVPRLIRSPMAAAEFSRLVVDRWYTIYGSPPPGLIDEVRVPPYVPPPVPSLALLCAERSVWLCLVANHVPETHGVALASTVADLPAGVPVAVLHDASQAGYAFLAYTRSVVRDRPVIDLGIRPRSVIRGNAVRLRDPPKPDHVADKLRASGTLTDDEIDWLCNGWWSPVAAVRPAVLLAAVASAADRARAAGDPDRVSARRVGFTTWPAR